MATDASARAVSAALAELEGDLLRTTTALEQKWSAEQAAAKAKARALHNEVLQERQSLQNSLGVAARLWETLRNVGSQMKDSDVDATAVALRNVTQTIHLLDFFEGVPDALNDAHSSLTKVIADGAHVFVSGNASMLYNIHAVLSAVERLRDIARLEKEALGRARAPPLPSVMMRVDQIREELDSFLMHDVFGNILSVSKSNPRFLVAAMRVVLEEEKRDEWWDRHLASYRLQFCNSVRAAQQHHNYKKRFFDAVEKQIDVVFKELDREFNGKLSLEDRVIPKAGSSRDAIDVEHALKWLKARVVDCEHVHRFVAPCVPSSFGVPSFYEAKLHYRIMNALCTLLRNTVMFDTGYLQQDGMVKIILWYSSYREGIGRDYPGIDSYLDANDRKQLVHFMHKHVARTIYVQISPMLASDTLRGDDGRFISSSAAERDMSPPANFPVSVLGSIDELVKQATILGIGVVRKAVAMEFAESLQELLDQFSKSLSSTSDETVSSKWPAYVCSVANNMASFLEYAEDLRDDLAASLEDEDRLEVITALESNVEQFRSIAVLAINDLTRSVELTLLPLTSKLFAPHTGTDIMLDIIGTLEDSLSNMKPFLLPAHFDQLTAECVRNVVTYYVSPFLSLGQNSSRQGNLVGTRSDYSGMKDSFKFNSRRSLDRPSLRTIRRSYASGGTGNGLLLMNSTAVVAQIDKDMENLTSFFRVKVEPFQRRQFHAILEPMKAVRGLYVCPPMPADLVEAYQNAKTAVRSAMEALRGHSGPKKRVLTVRTAELIWSSRPDVNSSVRDEAVLYSNVSSPTPSIGKGMLSNFAQKDAGTRNASMSSRFSVDSLGVEDSGIVWSPSVSVSRRTGGVD